MTTILNPYHLTVDGLSLGTYAHQIEVVRGIDVLPDRRYGPSQIAFRHGTSPTADWYFESKVLPLLITVSPWDDDGDQNHTAGMQGHLRDNLDELMTIFGKRSMIDVRRFVPAEESPGDDLIELQAWATVGKGTIIDGGVDQRQFRIDLILPYPMWHELPEIELAADTSHTLDIGGTAPVADMVFEVSGDGTVSDDLGHSFTIDGSASAVTVDVGKREAYEGGNLKMSVFSLDGGADNWFEWPAQSTVNVTSDVSVAISYFNARH